MSATVTFDPEDVEWGHTGSDRERITLQLDANLKPTHITPEPFPWIYGHKSTPFPVLAYSTQWCPLTWSYSTSSHSARGNPIPDISSATHPSFPWAITAVRVQICGKASKINKWLYWLKIDELMVNVAKLKVS